MAEEKTEELEGFDDIDGLLDEDPGGKTDGDFAGELDDFLGADDAGGDDPDAGGENLGGDDDLGLGDDGGEDDSGDSELDSFFEDLSTIDDLEVSQEEAPEEAAAEEAPAEAAEPMDEMPAAAPVAAAVEAPAAPKEKKKRPWLKKVILLLLLGLVGGSGYYAYTTMFPEGEAPWPEIPVPELPWPLVEEILEEAPLEDQQVAVSPLPPAPPPLEKPPAPPTQPAAAPPPPKAAGPPPEKGKGYGVQVATCFFAKCVKGFQNLLARNNRGYLTVSHSRRNESLEILSGTVFSAREIAEQTARRINAEHRLEGQAYVIRSGGGYKISMGTFPDLSRASLVRDSLNQRLEGEVFFTTRLKTRSFKMSKVVTGRYASAAEARQELRALRNLDSRFKGAFIVRN